MSFWAILGFFDLLEPVFLLTGIDYSDKRSLPLTVPEYKYVEKYGDKYVVFCIHMAGRYLCSRRYSDFTKLEEKLKREFLGFSFPRLPGKWPFALTDHQLDSRRRGLESFLERTCSVRAIVDHALMRDFLTGMYFLPEFGLRF